MELLSAEEVRVLGALIEKEYITPEYYPLTLNALTNACNQSSSREPVVEYTAAQTLETIEELRKKGLAAQISGPDMRVMRYRENIVAKLNLSKEETAVLCVLMLRGPQTVGEIKGRCIRIFEFTGLDQTLSVILAMASRESEPLVVKLEKHSGREPRYAHLLSGSTIVEQPAAPAPGDKDRIALLEIEVKQLKAEVLSLSEQLLGLKRLLE
jgi:uncharacterized protein YceH (UPF0502 family)